MLRKKPDVAAELASFTVGRLRSQRTELQQVLHGFIKPNHRVLIQTHLRLLDAFNASPAGSNRWATK